jgi:hypothetical protein
MRRKVSSDCLGFAAGVVQVARPGVLVEGHQGGVVFGDDLAEAMRAHHFGVGQVSHNLPDAPLAWGGQEILLLAKNAGQDHGQQLRAAAVSLQ